jgi:hypothetical protein
MQNGRCRLHGGKSPGAPKGNRNAWKHGGRSAETIQLRRAVNLLARLLAGSGYKVRLLRCTRLNAGRYVWAVRDPGCVKTCWSE